MSDFSISTFESKIAFHIKNLASIDKTAQQLKLPKTTVTTALNRIEKKIGKKLFIRKQRTGNIEITQDGVDIVPKLEQIYLISESIKESDETWNTNAKSGNVILTSTQTILEGFFSKDIVKFTEQNPNIQMALCQLDKYDHPAQQINEIFIGKWDGQSDKYEYYPFHVFEQKLWVSEKYLKKSPPLRNLKDLKNHRFLFQQSVYNLSESLTPLSIKQLTHEAQDIESFNIAGPRLIDVLAKEGLGIMPAAEETVKLSNLKLTRVLPHFTGDKTEIYVRVDKRFSNSPLANYFVDWIFETRDKALASIGIPPNTRYTKLYPENPEKN